MALWIKVIAAAAVTAMLLLGVRTGVEALREQGREQVRDEWTKADAKRISAERLAALEQQSAERAKEQRMAAQAEEKTREATQREDVLRQRVAALQRRNDGLRGTIARLDADSRARRDAGTCPAADAEADAAAHARALLGRCADRYRSMGERAAGLASQVIGLQDHVLVVQPEAAPLLEAMP